VTGGPRVVFDCNVFFQALIGRHGPAGACIQRAVDGDVELFCSEHTLGELREVTMRPPIARKFAITPERLEALVNTVRSAATFIDEVPARYVLRTDPDDSHYINLALAANARLIVSRDRDLLRLAEAADTDSREFRRLFPHLSIMDPPALLRFLADSKTG
jgi:putative PIN family toxin of toxin-antitoxin system